MTDKLIQSRVCFLDTPRKINRKATSVVVVGGNVVQVFQGVIVDVGDTFFEMIIGTLISAPIDCIRDQQPPDSELDSSNSVPVFNLTCRSIMFNINYVVSVSTIKVRYDNIIKPGETVVISIGNRYQSYTNTTT